MSTFQTIGDEGIARLIAEASRKVIYISPGVGSKTFKALGRAMECDSISLTIVVDSEEDAYRIGYGDPGALELLHKKSIEQHFALRRQQQLRIGLLVADDIVVIWNPIAQSVEAQQEADQPNAIFLASEAAKDIEAAVASNDSEVLPSEAEIGKSPLTPEILQNTIDRLKKNPPAPFDLSQKARVFSTRFQFVETELIGAKWTNRKMKISSFLLNSDLPEELQEVLETQILPFKKLADRAFEVPLLVGGEAAYNKDGARLTHIATQSDILKSWDEIRDRYIRHVKGFGWLIRKEDLADFRERVCEFEETLKSWVDQFREYAQRDEDQLVETIVNSIEKRLENASIPNNMDRQRLESEVQAGLGRMQVVEPKVRLITKDVSWESSRDQEFTMALGSAFDARELAGWFNEFTAARELSGK